MRLVSGAPYYLVRNGFSDPPAVPPRSCDVAIIGAGITGALIADDLTSAGFTVTVLDRRVPAAGSSSACTAILTYELDLELCELAERIGMERASRAYRACVRGIDAIAALITTLGDDCGFGWRPSLYGAAGKRDAVRLQREAEARQQHGLAAEYWNAARIQAETGFDTQGGIRVERSAALDPVRFTRALFARAERSGAVVCPRTAVTSWTSDRRGVHVCTTGGDFDAQWIVFATGYETPAELREGIVALHSTYALVTTPCDPAGFAGKWADRCMFWDTLRPYNYLRGAESDRILAGGLDVPFRDAAWRDRLLPRKTAQLERVLRRHFPQLEFETEFAWAGTFGETTDGLPYIGARAGLPRALFALGYGGNGVTFSMIAARTLRNIVLGEGDENLDLFAFDRHD